MSIFKVFDFVFIVGLMLVAYKVYPDIVYSDLILIIAFMFVGARKHYDVNVLTLSIVGCCYKLIAGAVATGATHYNGFVYYPLTAGLHFICMWIIALRPLIFSNKGPYKNRTGFAIIPADTAVMFVLAFMIIFDVLLFIEHGIRRIGPWYLEHIRFLYDSYVIVQLAFTLITLLVLVGILTIDTDD